MGAGAELERLLARPSPLLLPWLARRVAMADLPIVASAAAPHQDLLPGWCWPVVADATAAVLAERGTDDLDLLHRLLRVLPPIAAYLAPEVRRAVSWDAVGADARTYAAIADERDGAPPAAVESRPELLRPPARAASLALLGDVRAGRPVAPSPDEAAYLLPFVAPAPEGWAGPAVKVLPVAPGSGAYPDASA